MYFFFTKQRADNSTDNGRNYLSKMNQDISPVLRQILALNIIRLVLADEFSEDEFGAKIRLKTGFISKRFVCLRRVIRLRQIIRL